MSKNSNLVAFAERELDIILSRCEDEESKEMQKEINKDILQIVKVFSKQGHSGFSASYAISLIKKLLNYEPITPLTGKDDEWIKLDYNNDTYYQNKRCSRVFKDKDGNAYDIEGKIFSDNKGKSWYVKGGGASRVYINFPYTPKTEKILVENIDEE